MAPRDGIVLRLTPDDGRTISLAFGGDVMAGRRFFDLNEDGDRNDRLLDIGANDEAHAQLLAGVRPALETADLAIVNLETPLIADPWFSASLPRPPRFHATKEFVFASNPSLAAGLRLAGVDIIGLANNHLHDALDDGAAQTLAALDSAGFTGGESRYGGGLTAADAWVPAIRDVRGLHIAFLGCTTIDGGDQPVPYVATASSGGAAACDIDAIRQNVASAARAADVVVFSIHGGFEYQREPSERIAMLSRAARDAGAALVIDHHPHVIGGVDIDESGLTAWTLGNLLFDQKVWPTFPSYVLTVYIRDGRPIRAVADPIVIDDFRPAGLVGGAADQVARLAAARSTGLAVLDDGALEFGLPATLAQGTLPATTPGSIQRLTAGWQPAAAALGEVGRDLLFLGSFEDDDVDVERSEGDLWLPPDRDRVYGPRSAASGSVGVRLGRDAANDGDAVLAPAHRVPIVPGRAMSFLAQVRSANVGSVALQLSWYNDLRGPSQTRSVVEVPVTGEWQVVRVDFVVPANAVAVLPLLRLRPPSVGQVHLDVDNVALVEWAPATEASAEMTYLRSAGAPIELVRYLAPGASTSNAPAWEALGAAGGLVVSVDPLPPGPNVAPPE